MATVDNYKIKIDVDGTQKVSDLTDKVDELGTKLGLAAAAGVAAFASLAASAVTMADAIVDTADAVGFSASKIYQLNAALQASGGEFGNADGLIKGFSKTLGEIQAGAKNTTAALNKLGLSQSSLAGLTDEQKLQLVINSLGKMEAGFERNRLAMDLLGKAAEGIDWTKFADGTNKAVDPELERRLRVAADTVDQLQAAFREFQLAALAAIAPVLESIKDINITADGAKKTIQVLGALIAAAFSVTVINQIIRVVAIFKTLVTTMRAAATAQAFITALVPGGLLLIGTAAAAATAAYIGLGKAMESAGAEAQRFKATASDLDNVSMPAIQSYSDGIKKLQKQLKEGVITQDEFNKKAAELEGTAKAPGVPKRTTTTGSGSSKNLDNQKELVQQIKAQTEQLRLQLGIQNEYRQAQINLIGIEGQRTELLRQNLNLEQQFALDSLDYAQRIQEEYSKGANASQEVVNYLREQLLIKRNQVDASKELNQQEAERIRLEVQKRQQFVNSTNALANYLSFFQDRAMHEGYLNLLEKTSKEYNIASNKLQLINESMNNTFGIMKDIVNLGKIDFGIAGVNAIRTIVGDIALELSKAYEKVDFGSNSFMLQMIGIQSQLIPTIQKLKEELSKYIDTSVDGNKELLDGLLQQLDFEARRHAQRMQNLDAENKKQQEMMESYVAGMKQAMEDIAESFKPYNMAQDAIKQGWGRMSDALDEFVETGKLNFADLARSIIQDITKMILKMLVFKAIEAGLNAIFPGLGSVVGALGGKASGGMVSKNTPYMVGERGPELFIPQSAGKIVPNNKLNNDMDSTRPPVATNIYNNYYISALDAKSVAQMFAENRKAIFGANKMAEREMSYAGAR